MYQPIDLTPFKDYLINNAKNSPVIQTLEIVGVKLLQEDDKYKLMFLHNTEAKRVKDYQQNRINNLFAAVLNHACDIEIEGDEQRASHKHRLVYRHFLSVQLLK